MFGFLNINKPPGPSSHDVVASVRRILPRKIKVGHAGTLDPLAKGVLVLCVGPATRLAEYVQRLEKRYTAEVTLAATSSTDDTEGEITETTNLPAPPKEAEIRDVLQRFVGRIMQVPPAYSAVHVNGQRSYKLARAGKQIDLPARQVEIHRIDLISYTYPHLLIDVRCGSGTYLRALSRDIGEALHVGGYCSDLIRTQVGPFKLDNALPIDSLDPQRDLLQPLLAVENLPRIVADPDQAKRLANGGAIEMTHEIAGSEIAIIGPDGILLAIGEADQTRRIIKPVKVFVGR